MTVGKIINAARLCYLKSFAAAVAEHRAASDPLVTEVVLRDASGAPAREGALDLPVRLDLVVVRANQVKQSVSIDSASRIDFKPVQFRWENRLDVKLRSFWWDDMRVTVEPILQDPSWAPLQEWFMKWFSADKDGTGEPLQVVHFLSDPEQVPTGYAFSIDLGTAPAEAFEELLDAVISFGGTTVLIGKDPMAG